LNYEPKILFNPKSEPVEFMYDHQSYIFKAGEKKLLDGAVAFHAIRHADAGLKEYEPESDDILLGSSDVAYDKMAWGKLKTLASQKKVFKLGMKKDEVIKAIIESDAL